MSDEIRELTAAIEALKSTVLKTSGDIARDVSLTNVELRSLSQRMGSIEKRVDELERRDSDPPPDPESRKNRLDRVMGELRAALDELEEIRTGIDEEPKEGAA